MAKKSNYSILVDVDLDLKDIESQLKSKKYKIQSDATGLKETKQELDNVDKSTKELDNSTQDLSLTYQQFKMIADGCVDVLKSMYSQVLELDSAVTEFKKVSDLQGEGLKKYVDDLSESGKQVARTGKPNRSEPVCCDGKAA